MDYTEYEEEETVQEFDEGSMVCFTHTLEPLVEKDAYLIAGRKFLRNWYVFYEEDRLPEESVMGKVKDMVTLQNMKREYSDFKEEVTAETLSTFDAYRVETEQGILYVPTDRLYHIDDMGYTVDNFDKGVLRDD